ncbi:MAG: CapA family protein [Pyrinomonadaceae bacterium]
MKHLIVSILVLSIFGAASAQNEPIEIAFVGDVLLARGVEKKINTYGPEYPFENVRHILSKADLAFANLEGPLASKCEKLEKNYSFEGRPKNAGILKYAGIDIVSLANNHSLDCGNIGLFETMDNLDSQNIRWVGAGRTKSETESPVFLEIKNTRIAFLAITKISPGSDESVAVAEFGRVELPQTIATMRKKADVVIVSIHWGTEYASYPDVAQTDLAEQATRAGADIVVGHHPHVLQGLSLGANAANDRKTLVAYSLGNFVFDSPTNRNRLLGESAILRVSVGKGGVREADVIPVSIDGYRPSPAVGDERERIFENLNKFSKRFETRIENGILKEETKRSMITADLDSDGTPEIIDLDGSRENTIEIRHGKELKWQGVPTGWKPWKIDTADVDGDGIKEVIVGVFKKTKFLPIPHNCLFVYGWKDGRAFPKWLGSRLSRPFTDFRFEDLDGKDGEELIALESDAAGNPSTAVYVWDSFGFVLKERGVTSFGF